MRALPGILVGLLVVPILAQTNGVDQALLEELVITIPKKTAFEPGTGLPDTKGGSLLRLNTREFDDSIAELANDPIQLKVDRSNEEVREALRRGRAHLVGKQHYDAVRHFYRAARLDPRNGEALSGLAVSFSLLGDIDRAVQIYERLLELFPANERYRGNFAAIKMFNKDYEGTIAVKPDFGEAHNQMGIRYAKSGAQQRALLAYELAIRHDPAYPGTYSNYGLALLQTGRYQEAIRAFSIGLEIERRLDVAIPRLLIALRKQLPREAQALDEPEPGSEHAGHYYTAARKYVVENQLERALAHYIQAIFLRPDRTELFNDVGVLLARMDRPYEAIPIFRRARLLNPNFEAPRKNLQRAQARIAREQHPLFREGLAWIMTEELYLLKDDFRTGLICLSQGFTQKGIEHLTEAVLADSEDERPRLALARALARSGEYQAAIKHAREALTLLPDRPMEYYSALAFLYELTGQTQLAFDTHNRALELAPEDPRLLGYLGKLLGSSGEYTRARRFYTRALTAQPDDPELQIQYGWVLRGDGRFDEAQSAYEKALELEPGHSQAETGLGYLALQRARPAEAERAFRRALEKDPGLGEAHAGLGFALLEQQQLDAGMAALSDALILMPSNQQALERLLTQLPAWHGKPALEVPQQADEVQAARAFEQAAVAFAAERYPEAVAAYAEAALHRPEAEYFAALSKALQATGRLDAAVATLQQALLRQPARETYRKEMSRLMLSAAQERNPAMTTLKERLKQKPTDARTHFQAANLHLVMNNLKQALRHYIEALRFDPDNPSYHASLIRTLILDGRQDQAIAHTIKACAARPKDLDFLNRSLWSLVSRSGLEADKLRPVLELARNSFADREEPAELRTLATVYAQSGEPDRAKAIARRALELARAKQDPDLVKALETDLARF